MEPKLRQEKRGREVDPGLIEATQRLTPEERLNAFLTHSCLMMELYQAGRQAREARSMPSTNSKK
jgi:hypothetical protein